VKRGTPLAYSLGWSLVCSIWAAAEVAPVNVIRVSVIGIRVAYAMRADPLHDSPVAPPMRRIVEHWVIAGGMDHTRPDAQGSRVDPEPLTGPCDVEVVFPVGQGKGLVSHSSESPSAGPLPSPPSERRSNRCS
jgi:hypothetical protein